MDCHALLQGIFPNQGSNLHCRRILYRLSHERSLIILKWVVYPFCRGVSQPGITAGSPSLQAGSLPAERICKRPGIGLWVGNIPWRRKWQPTPVFFSFFSFIFISWRLITLQYCSSFCHTLTWISHGFACIPHPDPPSHLPLHPIHLGRPSAPGPSTCLMHPTWAGDLFHPR